MPNIGKPSTGCFACRRMKVRCDESKPFCSRCTRAKRTCPGYADPFRYEEPARTGDGSIRRKRASPSDMMCLPQTLLGSRSLVHPIRTTTAAWYDKAHAYFFHTHTAPTKQTLDPNQGHLSLVETYCSTDGRESYLKEALHAVSLLTLSHRVSQFKWMITKAVLHYTKALRAIRLALAKAAGTSKDDLLIALWCIQKIEVTFPPRETTSPSTADSQQLMNGLQETAQVHSAGISAVLRCHGNSSTQFSSALGKQLFYAVNLQLTATDCVFGTQFHHPMDASHPLRFQLYSTTAQLTAECRAILTGQSATSIELLAQRAMALNAELKMLPQDLPSVLYSVERTLGQFQMVAHYFNGSVDAIPWLYYHTIRLRTLRIVQLSSKAPGLDVTDEIKTQGLAIASLIPGLLGQNLNSHDTTTTTPDPLLSPFCCAAAVFAMHACSSVMTCTELDEPDLRQWILDQYIYIGTTYGIKEAFAFRGYFLSGSAMSDIQTLWTVVNGTFPRLTPVYMVGQEKW